MITFSATVEACEKVGAYYEAVLNRTAFFPEGGGQEADTGIIGDAKVVDVREKDGVIYHKILSPLKVGDEVIGVLDWEERFSKMQQHSGEHIVSGLVYGTYGYHNVGFHMGKDAITMDFDGPMNKEQLKEIEKRANEAVVADLEVQVLYPTEEELKDIFYRSKIEIEGQVRLVTIPGHDACACCAPHVKKTGEIGVIKLIGLQNYKGGVRVSMLCGFRALADYEEKAERMKQLSVMLSAPECEVVDEVERLKEEISRLKMDKIQLEQRVLSHKVDMLPEGNDMIVLFETELDGTASREMVNLMIEKKTDIGAVFYGNEKDGYRYVIGGHGVDVRRFAKYFNENLQGRGGGKPEMVQGSLVGSEMQIREAMETCKKNLR